MRQRPASELLAQQPASASMLPPANWTMCTGPPVKLSDHVQWSRAPVAVAFDVAYQIGTPGRYEPTMRDH